MTHKKIQRIAGWLQEDFGTDLSSQYDDGISLCKLVSEKYDLELTLEDVEVLEGMLV